MQEIAVVVGELGSRGTGGGTRGPSGSDEDGGGGGHGGTDENGGGGAGSRAAPPVLTNLETSSRYRQSRTEQCKLQNRQMHDAC